MIINRICIEYDAAGCYCTTVVYSAILIYADETGCCQCLTCVAEGTPEGLQLDAVFQSVLVAPVQVLKVPDDVATFKIPEDAAK